MRTAKILAACAACLIPFAIAHADPGGTSGVYGSGIKKGDSEIEYKFALMDGAPGGDVVLHKFEAAHSVTSWWRTGAIVKAQDTPGRSTEVTAVAIENVFDITPTRDWPVHFGAYLELSSNRGGADAFEGKLLAEFSEGPFRARLNLKAEREIGGGASDDWETGYAAQARWSLPSDWTIGVEAFGDFGPGSAHAAGPRLTVPLRLTEDRDIQLSLSWLAGLSNTDADQQFRLGVEYEF